MLVCSGILLRSRSRRRARRTGFVHILATATLSPYAGAFTPMSKKRASIARPAAAGPAAIGRPKNRLLAGLPDEDFRRMAPDLKTVPLTAKQVLLKRGDKIRYVFFPNGGVCSVTAMMKDGTAVEVATVGDEGMLGISAFLGGNAMPGESMVQVPQSAGMSAERMPVDAFQREVDRRGALHEAVNRYTQGIVALMMQSTGCMGLHQVQERCCRWLLMTHDRIRSDQFTLSHEFLAMMLGSARPTVTLVARSLQDAGLIRYKHARITILDRRGLEAASCECYATVKAEFDRLGL
jgi:CRP-like cAMP-binding protein